METTWKFVEIWSSTYRSNIDVESTWIRRGVPVWFLVDAHRFGVAFPKLQTFSKIFWALHIDYSQYKKMILRIFFICSFMKLQRQKFLETVHSSRNTSYLRTTHFCAKCQYQILALIFPLYIRKNPVEKLFKVSEMELKTYTPVGLKFVFEKTKFKVLHYIQHDFIRQRPRLSKNRINMFKSLVIN